MKLSLRHRRLPASFYLSLPLGFSILAFAGHAQAEEPRAHVGVAGAHAIGGTQSSEFGAGGAGSGSVEMPLGQSRLGIQATAGALVLSKGDAPKDAGIAQTSTGAAFLGTFGVRVRGFDATKVAGPWMDGNFGIAQTGSLSRPAFDAHVGWDFRVSQTSRIDVGPFVGYTQIFQPDAELRSSDARILTAGLSFSLGMKERARAAEPKGVENPPPALPPPPVFTQDEVAIAEPDSAAVVCKDGEIADESGDCGDGVRVFENRILLEDVVHFDFDSAKISTQSHALVRKIAGFIMSHEDIVDISIEGHADEIGTEDYNNKISRARAESMREMLVKFGVSGSRLRVVGYGKSMPKIVTLKREVQNRRVEMFVTREQSQSQSKKQPASPATEQGNVTSTHGKSSR